MIEQIHEKVLKNYFDSLVNGFFKILPIKESEEDTLTEYMQSLQLELIGCNSLFADTNYDSALLSLIAILQYLIDNDCEMKVIRREVFKSIGICKMLKKKYFKEG